MSDSLYVHVPFCNHICAYCDFMRCGYHSLLADRWLSAIAKEIKDMPLTAYRTIYIGGGTPSALSHRQLQRLLELLKPFATALEEYTIEVNADSFTADKIALCKQYGINRISMGAQTFQKDLLKRIDRIADYDMITTCIEQIRKAGIVNISLDLMYGLPDQTMEKWQADLKQALALPITHLSLYALSIEANSRFGREQIAPCDEELEADFYEMAIKMCEQAAFEQYEISSFAKAKQYSQHNLAYWHYDDFDAIGCGASGKAHHMRYDNTRNLHTYIQYGPSPQMIKLSKEDEMFETMMMGLRTKNGVSLKTFEARFACSYHDVFAMAIQKHQKLGNLIETDGRLYTSKQGMMILHEILVDFL